MTDAEFHQQQLEQQQLEQQETEEAEVCDNQIYSICDYVFNYKKEMNLNHAKMVAAAYTIRDSKQDPDFVRIAIKYLLEALGEYEQLRRKM